MKKIRLISLVLMICMLISVTAIYGFAADQTASGDMTVHFLDVGQGLAVLVQSEGQNLIYDGGGRDSSSFVVSYLKQQNIDTIDYLISSHYDEDHIAGLIGCLSVFDVLNIIGSDYVRDSDLYNSFMNKVYEQELEVKHPEIGTRISIGSGYFTILSVAEDSESDNDNSVSIMLTNGQNRFLLTGDSEKQNELSMIDSGISLDCDVLCVGHHGSNTSTTDEFLAYASPSFAVISVGNENPYGHPSIETMEKLEASGIQVYRTDKQGTIIAVSDGTEINWNQDPCNDYAAGSGVITEIVSQVSTENADSASSGQYVLNTNTKKFHYSDCKSVKQMKEKNKSYYDGTRDDVISMGYDPCHNCNP